MVTDARREESVRLHVGFEVLGRFQGERRIVDDRFLADLAFEAVPQLSLSGWTDCRPKRRNSFPGSAWLGLCHT